MSLENCIKSAKQWAKENSDVKLSSRELEAIGNLLSKAEEMGATPAEKNALMSDLVNKKLEHDQAIKRAAYLRNVLTQEQGVDDVTTNGNAWADADKVTGEAKGKRFVDAFNAHIQGGSSRPGINTNMDPSYVNKSAFNQYVSFARNVLSKEEQKLLQGLDISDTMSRDIFLELGAMRSKTQLGQTNNDMALSIAKAIRKTQDYTLQDLKGVNPYFSESEDFLVSRIHDRDKMMAVPKDEWVKDAMKHFSGSFVGMSPEEKVASFGEIYDAKKNGSYVPSEAASNNFWSPRGTSKNQGLAAAPRRVLVATSPLDEWKYAAKYGQDLWPTVMQGLNDRAQSVATIQKWGLHADANFQSQYGKVLSYLKKSDGDAAGAFERERENFKDRFEATQVRRSNEAFTLKGRAAQNLMAVENMALLGMHVPRSLSSYATALSLARDGFGKSLPENAVSLASHMAKALIDNGGRDVALQLGVTTNGFSRDLMGQLGGQGKIDPGMIAKGAELMGKATLTDRFVSSQKAAIAEFTARRLGALSGTAPEKLTSQQNDELMRYGLNGQNWNIVRQAVAKDGPLKGAITPEAIRGLTDEQTRPILKDGATPRDAMAARTKLALSYSTLLNDEAGLTAGESNSRSRYAAFGTSTVDDNWGIARRFMMQFKQAALIQQQVVQRVYRSGGGNTSNISGVFQHVIAAGFMGMVGQYMIDAATGKTPASPFSPEMLGRAGLNGVGLGVMGDALFHALQQPTASKQQALMLSDVLGAGPGTIAKGVTATFKTGQGIVQALQGQEKNGQYGGRQWASLLHGLTPGQNIFYTKAALDYMLMNAFHEFMGGNGYLQSLRQSVGKTPAWPESLGGPGGGQQFTFGGKNFWE